MKRDALLKKIIMKALPEPILRIVKKIYYAHAFKNVKAEDLRDGPIINLLVKPGEHTVDIGANIGYYSKVLAELVGPSGYVYAVEPVPQTFDMLKSNLRRWKVLNVQPFECAVSDTDEIVKMEVPLFGFGGEDFYGAKITEQHHEDPLRTAEVKTMALDSISFQHSPRIDFIKMDAMGHELKCILGAEGLIKKDHPAWLIAMYSDPNDPHSEAAKIFEILTRKSRYHIFWYDGENIKEWSPGETSYRYFFLLPKHLERLKEAGFDLDHAQ